MPVEPTIERTVTPVDDEGERYTLRGAAMVVHSTRRGDGAYQGSDGRTYGVDAGNIGRVLRKRLAHFGANRAGNSSVDQVIVLHLSLDKAF